MIMGNSIFDFTFNHTQNSKWATFGLFSLLLKTFVPHLIETSSIQSVSNCDSSGFIPAEDSQFLTNSNPIYQHQKKKNLFCHFQIQFFYF